MDTYIYLTLIITTFINIIVALIPYIDEMLRRFKLLSLFGSILIYIWA